MSEKTTSALEQIADGRIPDKGLLTEILQSQDQQQVQALYKMADQVRHRSVGDEILLRGVIEFSNHCRNRCLYCGIGRHNHSLVRYRLSKQQILSAVDAIAATGIKTVVLQSGEDPQLDPDWLADLIVSIKSRTQMAVTLSVGRHPQAYYKLWRHAGADRYLLKIETTDPVIYGRLCPGMDIRQRLQASMALARLGYENGSGNIIGLPGQGPLHIAEDLLFFRSHGFEMLAIGPFIPHPSTALAGHPPGDVDLTLKTIALARLMCRYANIPATSALAVAKGLPGRINALMAGANVVMVNFTPAPYNGLYDIYPGRPLDPKAAYGLIDDLKAWAKANGRFIGFSVGSSRRSRDVPLGSGLEASGSIGAVGHVKEDIDHR